MTADLLITQLLEAVEVGDDGVYLKPLCCDKNHEIKDNAHAFEIIHPVHGYVGYIGGRHNPKDNSFNIGMVDVFRHPNYKSQRRRPTHPRYNSLGRRPTHPHNYDSEITVSNYSGMSRTFVRSALKSLMQHIPNLKTITGHNRITGTHIISRARTGNDDMANTSIRIPRNMRRSV